jgi:hypothetical protein
MSKPRLPKAVYEETARLFYQYERSLSRAAKASGVTYQTFASRIKRAREMGLITDSAASNAESIERVVEATVVVKPVYRIQQECWQ